jgi:cell wall-associated NlpC family hydrolase
MEGRVLTSRTLIVRSRLAALIACSLIATLLPFSARAEYGIPAGSGAVVTAGQPLLVRVTPGWDAQVAYEIADGSYVTVWDVAQTAPDGSLWYPVDGGYVPADGITSEATLQGGLALYQEAAPDAAAADQTGDQGVAPATDQTWTDPAPATDPAATTESTDGGNGDQWVDPNATSQAPADQAGQWVDPNATADQAPTDQWVDPNAATDPAPADQSGQWVDPNANATNQAPTDQWVDPNATTGQDLSEPAADPNAAAAPAPTDQWTDPAPADAAPTDVWSDPAPVDTGNSGGTEPWGEPIATATIAGTNGDGAVCRAGPDRSSQRLAVLGEGQSVDVRGDAVGQWQPVDCAGVGGYVDTALLSWDPVATSNDNTGDNSGAGNGDDGGRKGKGRGKSDGGGGGGSGEGGDITSFAMQYVGYPYAYAGEGPYAFDCSGFTKFVIQNTLGIDITHDMATQASMGHSVSKGDLQPGDLVFFQNTFQPGLSHAGIYIGNGQFVHAENESTGVRVSDLNNDYYGSRWYGATRLT